MGYDIVIKNGTIIDGSGSEPFEGDVALVHVRLRGVTHNPRDRGVVSTQAEDMESDLHPKVTVGLGEGGSVPRRRARMMSAVEMATASLSSLM